MKQSFFFIMFSSLLFCSPAFSQKKDSTSSPSHFTGSISATHNGISLIPTFSLGKPATIINLSMGKGKLSFEPEMRFALEGKPWSFLFWWRYRVKADRFRFNFGAHPALNFKTETVTSNGVSKEVMVTRRYLATELSPNYMITNNISAGIYYLYSRGLDIGTTKNTHFVTVNSNISNIKLSKQFLFRLVPQFYYLKMDQQDGFYFTSTFVLSKRNFPLSLSAIINKTIQTKITASKDFVWNATLTYSFGHKYVKIN